MRDVSLRDIAHWYEYMNAQIKEFFSEGRVKRYVVYTNVLFTNGGGGGSDVIVSKKKKIGIFKSRAMVPVSLASSF